MRLNEVLRIIRAVRLTDASSAVTLERVQNGDTKILVKVAGRDIRVVEKRARETYDRLAKRYNGGK